MLVSEKKVERPRLLSPRTCQAARILQIVGKNTSTLDYTAPLLWKLKREYPEATVSILYCAYNRKQMLRDSTFFSALFGECGIREYDLADFLKGPIGVAPGLWRSICNTSRWDRFRQAGRSGIRDRLRYLADRAEVVVERGLGAFLTDTDGIIARLDPDVVFFDCTGMPFYGRDSFLDSLDTPGRLVIFTPQAPHYRELTHDTGPFDSLNGRTSARFEYWMPFKFGAPWLKLPERKSQFVPIGYPGFDREWLSLLLSGASPAARPPEFYSLETPLQCMLIMRPYFKKGVPRPAGADEFILDYEVVFQWLKRLSESLRSCGAAIEAVVKAHPSNNFHELADVLKLSGIPRWRISHEPVYALISQCDFAVSLFSTSLLIPVMAGLPVIVVDSELQGHVHSRWDVLERLYRGLEFFVDDPADLPARLKRAAELAGARRRPGSRTEAPDVRHLRRFFPDGAMARGMERLELLLTGKGRTDGADVA